jgi:hypothetical protein
MPPKNRKMIKPLMIKPARAAGRLAFRNQATRLTTNAAGGVRSVASPPRAVSGDPQPGRNSIIIAMTAGATSDKPRPILPAFERGWFSSGGLGLTGFTWPQFHNDRISSMRRLPFSDCIPEGFLLVFAPQPKF